MAAPAKRDGPVLIAYDGRALAGLAVREAGALFGGLPALVVTVWKEGLGFELAEDPGVLGVPVAPVDVRTVIDIDDITRERAQRTAQHGADLAVKAGFSQVDGLAVADDLDVSIADTIVNLARERDAQAIVVGAHRHGRLAEIALGSTSSEVLRHAPCPTVVVREPPEKS
jgi:nucleotide-binding universal stress UspA family protein